MAGTVTIDLGSQTYAATEGLLGISSVWSKPQLGHPSKV